MQPTSDPAQKLGQRDSVVFKTKVMDNSVASPLLRLPGELRNYVYRRAIILEKRIELNTESIDFSCQPIQFLHVCQQIRKEAYGIFLRENRFQYTAIGWHRRVKYHFLETMGQKGARLIQDIAVRFPNYKERVWCPAQPSELSARYVLKVMVFSGEQIRDEVRQLCRTGIHLTSIKFASSFLANCSTEDLKQSQVLIDREIMIKRLLEHLPVGSIPQLKQSQSGHRTLDFGNLQLPIEHV